MSADVRGWRLALLPDALVNPPPRLRARLPDVLTLLEGAGYGLLQLPPSPVPALLLAVIADQVAEYAHHGYAVVAIGMAGRAPDALHWRRLSALLRRRAIELPPRHLVSVTGQPEAEARRLAAFLAGYDLPLAERRRWRI
ncbi:MAG: hypothetical protein JOZ67_09840 [Gammaproteobacteria bacterium]|nr:hypothetical protein [Gammaproteobacteria bacterium]MBV9696387.1 hypothetical protein [Gammaproteobacteria bacterium]